jgi:hypothetical protein
MQDWPVLISKMGELLRRDYDWSAEIATITAPGMLASPMPTPCVPST